MVGDRDRTQPLRLGAVEHLGYRHGAVVGVLRVEVEVGQEKRAVRQRVGRPAGMPLATDNAPVDLLEQVGERPEALGLRGQSRCLRQFLAPLRVLAEAGQRGRDQFWLFRRARRVDDRYSGARGLEREPVGATQSGDESGCAGQLPGPRRFVQRAAHEDPSTERARHVRAAAERTRTEDDELPAGDVRERACGGPEPLGLVCTPFEHDPSLRRSRAKSLQVDSVRKDRVVAGKALARGLCRGVPDRGQGVDSSEQLLPLRAPRRICEALRRVERRHRDAPGLAKGQVREARKARLVRVDEVEAVGRECERQVRTDPDRNAEAAPPRDRDRRAEGNHSLERCAVPSEPAQRPAAGGQHRGAVRWCEHDDVVAAALQLLSGTGDVVVDRVRLRPCERRDHAHAQTHDPGF